jgi:hypothetical protein
MLSRGRSPGITTALWGGAVPVKVTVLVAGSYLAPWESAVATLVELAPLVCPQAIADPEAQQGHDCSERSHRW